VAAKEAVPSRRGVLRRLCPDGAMVGVATASANSHHPGGIQAMAAGFDGLKLSGALEDISKCPAADHFHSTCRFRLSCNSGLYSFFCAGALACRAATCAAAPAAVPGAA
jgi:hypothetical protein